MNFRFVQFPRPAPPLRGGPSSSAAGFKGSELRFEEEGHWGTAPPFRNHYATRSAVIVRSRTGEMFVVRSLMLNGRYRNHANLWGRSKNRRLRVQ
jgi:hypothetical protein